MHLGKFILIFFPIIISINYFIIKNYKYLLLSSSVDKEFYKPQAFHNKPVPRIGGFLIFIYFIFLIIFFLEKNVLFFKIITLGSFFFLIGFLGDINFKISANKRLFLMITASILVIFFFDIKIFKTQFYLLDFLLNNYKLFSVIFVCLCLLFVSNGCNLIDGFNGLLIIHVIIILAILYFINYQSGNYIFLQNAISILLLILISILFYNFPKAKIFLGDGGAYFLGTIISLLVIEINNQNMSISPFFFAGILYYLFFEVFFSFFRKIFLKMPPLKPDKYHLHMFFFHWFFSKNKNINKANYLTGLFINIFYFFSILPLLFNYKNALFCKLYFFILLNFYLISYFVLRKKTLNLTS
jgi:UDP-N-acetylmuramyl pentapeptide phosphotransferase/UDP-N-acetylglucosamine-1-phosphate transferase